MVRTNGYDERLAIVARSRLLAASPMQKFIEPADHYCYICELRISQTLFAYRDTSVNPWVFWAVCGSCHEEIVRFYSQTIY